MKIKTSELSGVALDWAVAQCEGGTNLHHDTVATWWFTLHGEDRCLSPGWSEAQRFCPSTDWPQGGPIIERELVQLQPTFLCAGPARNTGVWAWKAALVDEDCKAFFVDGPTPLIAAMRCFVSSKLGDEVEVPEELI